MDRYGEAIEYDLHAKGLDLLDFFRGKHSWRKLLVILERLPRASHFRQAQADDEEFAEAALAAQEDGTVKAVAEIALSEFTPEHELLSATVELLQAVNSNLRALNGDRKPPGVKPLPRPRTAIDRLRDKKRQARFNALVAEVEEAQARYEARAQGH